MAKKATKSETLTIRMDPKTRFMLEFVARLRGQTITTVIERAISDAADQAKIRTDEYGDDLTWRDFWNVMDGMRELKIYQEPALRPTFEEEKRLHFTEKHWEFFYTDRKKQILKGPYLEVLWPRIDEFIAIDDENRATNYFAADEAMTKALLDANLPAPDVMSPKNQPKGQIPQLRSQADEDDIPF